MSKVRPGRWSHGRGGVTLGASRRSAVYVVALARRIGASGRLGAQTRGRFMDRLFRAGVPLVFGLSILGCRESPTRAKPCAADLQTVTLAELRGTTLRATGNGGCVNADITAAEGRYL